MPHQQNVWPGFGHSDIFGEQSEQAEEPAFQISRTTHLGSVTMLSKDFDCFQRHLAASLSSVHSYFTLI